MNLLETLEKDNPGITKIELDEDGAIMMDEDEPAPPKTCSRCSTISSARCRRSAGR